MREILFRGKPTEYFEHFKVFRPELFEGNFVYGSLVICDDRYFICTHAMCAINSCVNNGMTTMVEVTLETVGEYSYFSDKNGKKIFEGDLVKYRDTVRSVEFNEEFAEFEFSYTDPVEYPDSLCLCVDYERCEVIGNIHDNPELLRGE